MIVSEIRTCSPRYAPPVSMAVFRDAEVTAVDRGLGPEGGGDLLAERVLGFAETAGVQHRRPRDAVEGEIARHLPR